MSTKEQDSQAKAPQPPKPQKDRISKTYHQVTIGGREIKYVVRTGTIVLKSERDEAQASIFFVAYTKEDTKCVAKRPITFSFNGGPGSSSVWLHLGLLGPRRVLMDETGYLWFESRADDVCISSGYRIGPFEVESAVDSHAAVLECAMIPSPDLLRGEIVKVFIVLRGGYKPSEELIRDIQQHVKRITAPYKYPREIEFVNELPKTISSKIRRKELRTKEFERKRAVIEKLKEKGLWLRAD